MEGGAHHLEGGEAMEVDNTHTTGQRRPRGLCSLPGKDTSGEYMLHIHVHVVCMGTCIHTRLHYKPDALLITSILVY